MATRAVNKTAKEGEQNARLLLSRRALSAIAIFRRAAFPSVRRWRCTAPYPLLAPAAPALCLSCFWRGRSPSPAFGAVFMRGGRQLFGAGRIQALVHGKIFANAFSGDWQWQYTRAVRSRALDDGKMLARCVPQRPTVADCALMRSWPDWQWQYSRAVRSRASIRGKIPPRCVPGRQSVAIFSSHASPRGLRTGKSPVRGKIRAPCIRKRAGSGRICAPCIRKAPQTAVWEYTARRSCQEGPLFAARTPRIMHGAQILPSVVAPNRPSARDPGAAEQCEPPELDRPAQETQPRRQRPRRLLGSKYRQQLPRYRHRSLSTPASSLSPRRTTLSLPTASLVETASTPPPPRRFAELRSPKGRAIFPTCGVCLLCSWQMRSAYKRQAEPLLRDYFVMVA